MNSREHRPFLYLVDERENQMQQLASTLATLIDAAHGACFKLEQQQLTLANARTEWLGDATAELAVAIENFQYAEMGFREALGAAASYVGRAPESTLRELALAVSPPWDYVFEQGRIELADLLAGLELRKAALREMLTRNYLAVTAALSLLGVGAQQSYDRSGMPAGQAAPSIILNTRV